MLAAFDLIAIIARLSLLVLGLVLILVLRALARGDAWRGLIRDARGALSPARIQALGLSVMVALAYLRALLFDPTLDALPPLSGVALALLAGGQGVYLLAKAGGGVDRLAGSVLRGLIDAANPGRRL